MRRAGVIGVLAVFAVSACEDARNGAPAVTGLAPSSVVEGLLPETVGVSGTNLFGVVVSSLDDDPPVVDNEWTATLGGDAIAATWIDDTRVDVIVPAGTPLGVYDVALTAPDGTLLALPGALTVTDEPVGLAVTIEDAPGGAGTPIGDATLMIDDTLTAHAVIYGTEGEFFMDAEVTWSVSGGIGDIPAGPATSATFTAGADGQGVITAAHPSADDGTTGTITVATSCDATCGDTVCCETAGEDDITCPEDCADSCVGCVGEGCIDDCGGVACTHACDNNCQCIYDCTDVVGTCQVDCRNQTTCDVDCTMAETCDLSCNQDAVCAYTCLDTTDCNVVCRNASQCDITCSGSDCDAIACMNTSICNIDCTDATSCDGVDCTGSAQCLLDCTGASPCNFDSCDGAEMSCPGDIIVCNRACP